MISGRKTLIAHLGFNEMTPDSPLDTAHAAMRALRALEERASRQ